MARGKDRHFKLTGDYSVKITKDTLNGVRGYDWDVYEGLKSYGPFVASGFCISKTINKAKKEALEGLGEYLHKISK